MSGFFRRLFRFRKKKARRPFCSAVLTAAGSSSRMGEDKLFLTLRGEAVLVHSLRALETCAAIDEVVVVTREVAMVPVGALCRSYGFTKVTKVLAGGCTRTESVRIGTLHVSEKADLIAIHDGARPLVTSEVIAEAVTRAAECHAAAPAVPVKDTLKRAADGLVLDTPERAGLFAVQTPQVFQASLICAALQQAIDDGVVLTDDCSAVERLGMTVALTRGSDENLKITTPADLAAAEGILAAREGTLA